MKRSKTESLAAHLSDRQHRSSASIRVVASFSYFIGRFCLALAILLILLPSTDLLAAKIPAGSRTTQKKRKPLRKPDVIYYSTPKETVDEMLRLAEIKPGEVLYDLGSGDGRIPIAAAQKFGIRAVGIEIDPKLVAEASANAEKAGVASLVSFRNEDMFVISLREATVVTLYLSEKLNVLLRPKLLRELRPGARIVSHDFRMGDWPPEETVRVPWLKGFRTVYKWTVPSPQRPRYRKR